MNSPDDGSGETPGTLPAVLSHISSLSGEFKDRSELNGSTNRTRLDRLQVLMRRSLELGATLNKISKALDWRDFEAVSSWIFEKNDFEVSRRVVLTNPRREIDILALRHLLVLIADCKHWKRSIAPSTMTDICKAQKERCFNLSQSGLVTRGRIYPLVITFLPWREPFHESLPIVPITELNNFLWNLEGFLDIMWFQDIPPP